MKISRADLDWAASQNIISSEQASTLWTRLESRHPARAKFDVANVAYYLGALIVMSALGWFMTLGWQRFGGAGIFAIALAYALVFALTGWHLWSNVELKVPGGLLVTLSVWMTPLAVYGLEAATGIWPQGAPGTFRDYHVWIKGSWALMEVATIVAGAIALRFVRFPFLTFPIAFSLWYMSMDLTPLLVHKTEFNWQERLWVSLVFGLVILVVAYLFDSRTEEDYSFWGYLFGLMAFWGGLSMMDSNNQLHKFFYCLINLGLMLIAVFLARRVFLVFGGVGVFGYLAELSYTLFKDSMLFPFALSLLGLFIIFLGVQYQRNRDKVDRAILSILPSGIQNLRPAAR
jgi:hypothetical protein